MAAAPLLREVDVVVVGGGAAGIRAATLLHKAGQSVVVLEARDRLGGRTHTATHNGKTVEYGGMWVGTPQRRVLAAIEELKLQTWPQYDTGRHVLDLAGTRTQYEGNISDIGAFGNPPEIDAVVAQFTAMIAELSAAEPWKHPRAAEWDAITLDEWLRANVKTAGTRSLVAWLNRVCTGFEEGQISLLFWLFFIKQSGGYANLSDIRGGAQERKVIQGAQSITEGLARQHLPAGAVVFDAAVAAIAQDDAGVTVETRDRRRFRGRRVVVAIGVPHHLRIAFSPALPPARLQLAMRSPVGAVRKVHIYYATPWWRQRGLSGELISDTGGLMLTYDNSPHDARYGALVGFVAGYDAFAWNQLDQAERHRRVVDRLVLYFGEEARNVTEILDKDWSAEEFSGGCYFSAFNPGVLSKLGHVLRQPHGRVHFCGTETAREWFGYIEGALESGERVADEVVALSSSSSSASAPASSTTATTTSTSAPPAGPALATPRAKL